MRSLARVEGTFAGPPPPLPSYARLARSPSAALSPWLFWETFEALDDETFLKIAEAGACHLLASIVLDHHIDGQVTDPAASALLQKALFDRGVTVFAQLFPPDSGFWPDFQRLVAEHLAGLSLELAGRAEPRSLTGDAAIQIAEAKVCPGILTVAALVEAAGQRSLLEPIERSIRSVGVSSQTIDDAHDWRTDVEARRFTTFLAELAPLDNWTQSEWPTLEDLEVAAEREWPETVHYRAAIARMESAIEAVYEIDCPRWTAYVHAMRCRADRLLKATLASYLVRRLEVSAAEPDAPGSCVSPAQATAGSARRVRAQTRELHEACQLALEAVLAAQRSDGSWIDFDLPGAGPSDAWVTAHVGLQLATMRREWAAAAIGRPLEAAVAFLRSKWRHGWGYSDLAPLDADSTAHALLFFHAVQSDPPRSTITALLRFQRPDGGFATYLQDSGGTLPENWCRSHPGVTPVAIQALSAYGQDLHLSDSVLRVLRRFDRDRDANHPWPAFWWNLKWYTAAAWCRAIESLGGTPTELHWPEDLSSSLDGNHDLDAALLLEVAIYLGRLELASEVADRLTVRQLESGLWPPQPALRQPPRGVDRPWEVHDPRDAHADVFGVYSSATILNRLAKFDALRQVS